MRQPEDRDTLSPICDTHSEISPEHCHPHWRMGGERKRERRGKRGISVFKRCSHSRDFGYYHSEFVAKILRYKCTCTRSSQLACGMGTTACVIHVHVCVQ